MPQHDCFLEKGTCDPKDFGGKGLELRLMLTRTARVVDSIWLLAVVSHKRTWTVRIPDISDEGFLSRRIFLHLLGMLGIWPEPSAQQKNEIKNVKNWKHMQKPSVPVTVIFRRFFDDTGSPIVECCLKPVVPSVQKVFGTSKAREQANGSCL